MDNKTYKKILKHRAKNGCRRSRLALRIMHEVDSMFRERVPRRRLTPIEKALRRYNPFASHVLYIWNDPGIPQRQIGMGVARKEHPLTLGNIREFVPENYNFHKEYMQQPASEPFAFNKAKYRPPFWASAVAPDPYSAARRKLMSDITMVQAQNPDKEFTAGDIEGPIEEGNKVKFRINMYFKDK